ncbi:MAG TPA: hypothetical protein VM581_02025 [Magnetospirillaceae bacterium]|nr:hypothetical protein [Magnetospirillaceae bacterium]
MNILKKNRPAFDIIRIVVGLTAAIAGFGLLLVAGLTGFKDGLLTFAATFVLIAGVTVVVTKSDRIAKLLP